MAEETGGQTTTASKTNLQQREAVEANWRMAERVLAGGSPGEWACPGWKVPCGDGVLGRCVAASNVGQEAILATGKYFE